MFQDQGLKRDSFPGTVGLEGGLDCLLTIKYPPLGACWAPSEAFCISEMTGV